ncbi:MAG: hypothetical protein IJ587_04950 [Synergistaceae bacterium]|nr:hypothetical protein [Synergistaceae bacterium]
MAVQYVQSSPGILSNIGDLASLAGMAIPGAQWLTVLGTGMKAADGLINGYGGNSGNSQMDALEKLKNAITGWKNPASGNIAKVANKAANSVTPATDFEELASRGWRLSN